MNNFWSSRCFQNDIKKRELLTTTHVANIASYSNGFLCSVHSAWQSAKLYVALRCTLFHVIFFCSFFLFLPPLPHDKVILSIHLIWCVASPFFCFCVYYKTDISGKLTLSLTTWRWYHSRWMEWILERQPCQRSLWITYVTRSLRFVTFQVMHILPSDSRYKYHIWWSSWCIIRSVVSFGSNFPFQTAMCSIELGSRLMQDSQFHVVTSIIKIIKLCRPRLRRTAEEGGKRRWQYVERICALPAPQQTRPFVFWGVSGDSWQKLLKVLKCRCMLSQPF